VSRDIDWLDLPDVMTASYRNYSRSPRSWMYRGSKKSGFYFRTVDPRSENIQKILKFLKANNLPISSVKAVYNRTLIESFLGAYRIMNQRFTDSPNIFNVQEWKNDYKDRNNTVFRDFVYQQFDDRVKAFQDGTLRVPLIPTVHATVGAVCEKIAETGFASLSKVDNGFYGKGIYLSTHAPYAQQYVDQISDPAILISWVLPGNPYPVIEHPKQPNNLIGSALKSGYTSHYVIVTNVIRTELWFSLNVV